MEWNDQVHLKQWQILRYSLNWNYIPLQMTLMYVYIVAHSLNMYNTSFSSFAESVNTTQ